MQSLNTLHYNLRVSNTNDHKARDINIKGIDLNNANTKCTKVCEPKDYYYDQEIGLNIINLISFLDNRKRK